MSRLPDSTRPPADPAALDQVRGLARQLDTSIRLPGGLRIGWDALLGLIPGVGDWAGALLSSYIILQAVRLGASREVLLRMVGNVGLEALVGAVPFLGDVFDAAWRANTRNVRLLEEHLAAPSAARRASRAWVLGIVVLLVALLTLGMTLAVLAFRALASVGSQA
ncbi:DUF4112 domain-containing protein [Archangium violaceum]|uniref:DUF4112 domain-containing protein n=1 Tax=Archangium violaceum TaxID=83451 RepID=UPI00195211BA|nr:DUF4112 domain-containing protein [Archangium violaceum]QRO00673.1 DUF4112 domain-containing protein [Archangium violaceum]